MGDDPKASDNPMHCLTQAHQAPRCGARTRQSVPCRSPAMLNGRCRMHGGTSPGAPPGQAHGMWKHGLRSAEVIERRRSAAARMRALRGTLSKLSQLASRKV